MAKRFPIIGILWSLLLSGLTAHAADTITLNPAARHQTIKGWEFTSYSGQDDPAFPLVTDAIFTMAVDDLGLTRIRLEVQSGLENNVDNWTRHQNGQIDNATWRCMRYSTINDNNDPFSLNMAGFQFAQLDDKIDRIVLPLRQKMAARGERLHINLNYVAFTGQITGAGCSPSLQYHHDDSPEEYAEFVLAVHTHMRNKYGFVPDTWQVILEPDNTAFWRGDTIGRAVVAAAQRLAANGFAVPGFVAPSTTCMGRAPGYIDALASIPGAMGRVSELTYHRYCMVSDQDLAAIVQRAAQHGKDTGMGEHIGADYGALHKDLTLGRNSVWQQFALAGPNNDDGSTYIIIDKTNPAQPTVRPAYRTKFLRQYFRYVRPGAVRIDAASSGTAVEPVAFIGPDGKYVVVLKANAAASFTVNNLPAGTYGLSYTTGNQYDVNLADAAVGAGGTLSAAIPGTGVFTVYGKSAAAAKAGDMNADGSVDVFDLSFFLFRWNTADAAADIDKSGLVDTADLSLLLANWS